LSRIKTVTRPIFSLTALNLDKPALGLNARNAIITLIEGAAAGLFVRKCYSKLTGAATRSESEKRDEKNVPSIDGTN
jgi:hypothetical protein